MSKSNKMNYDDSSSEEDSPPPPIPQLMRSYNCQQVKEFKHQLDHSGSVWPKRQCVHRREILAFGYREYTWLSQEEKGAPYIQTDVVVNINPRYRVSHKKREL